MLPKLRNGVVGNGTLKITAASGHEVTLIIDQGVIGPQGPAGVGVPPGGNAGQVLAKVTSANYDADWISLSGLNYLGTWNAATNTPTLVSGEGFSGGYYICNVAGTTDLDGIADWKVNDWAVFNGTIWQKIDNTDSVTSVNGKTGAVVLGYADVGAPSVDGTDATGSWSIDISGTAANATFAATAGSATTADNATTADSALEADHALASDSATTADSATKATAVAGGLAGSLPYQIAIDTTTFLPVGSTGQILTVVDGAPSWQNGGGGSSLTGRTDALTPFATVLGVTGANSATGANNTVIGFQAGNVMTTGNTNTFIGSQAGKSVINQTGNTFIGANAGELCTGSSNLFVGSGAGDFATNCTQVTLIGVNSGSAVNASAAGTTGVGFGVFNALTSGANNTAMGWSAGYALTTGSRNSAFGNGAGNAVITGNDTTYIGHNSGTACSGSSNTAVGSLAMDAATTLTNATAVGQGAIGSVATAAASGAVAVGKEALAVLTTGALNTAIGYQAGAAQTIGSNNVYLGYQAGSSATSGAGNTFIGTQAAKLSNGSLNTVVGYLAGNVMTTAGNNTLVGYQAGVALTSGGGNILIGDDAGANLTTGTNNVIIGSINAPTSGVNGWIMLADSTGDLAVAFNDASAMSFDGTNFGTAGQVLKSVGDTNSPSWQDENVVTSMTVAGNITAPIGVDTFFLNGNSGGFTVTIPTAVGNSGARFVLKRTDLNSGNIITVQAPGSQIEGTSVYSITVRNSVTLTSDGTNYWITSSYNSGLTMEAPVLLSAMGGDGVATVTFDPVDGAADYVAEVTPI